MISITSDHGHIGPFWWVNSITTPIHLYDATYNGSHHIVWRQGASGWGFALGRQFFVWRLIK